MSHSPKDFMTPAQSCAKEIWGVIRTAWNNVHGTDASETATPEWLTEIIQRLLSSEVAKVHGEYQKLAKEMMRGAVGHTKTYTAGFDAACRGILALAPNKEGQMSNQRFECVYCGREHGSPNGTGSDISCCRELGHVRPIGEGFDDIQPGSMLDDMNRMAALIGKPPIKAPR